MTDQPTGPTVKTVVAHAQKLKITAERIMAADVYARPWYPTTAGARQQFNRELAKLRAERGLDADMEPPSDALELDAEAARRAIAWMDSRIARDVIAQVEHDRETTRRRKVHRRRQSEGAQERESRRQRQTPGERLDKALAELSVIGSVRAAALDADVISGSRTQAEPRYPGDPAGKAKHETVKFIRFVEREVDEAKRRLVEEQREL